MVSAFAEFERSLMSERVKAGIARARAQGKRLGRPPLSDKQEQAILTYRKQGLSLREIVGKVGSSKSTVSKFLLTQKPAGRGK